LNINNLFGTYTRNQLKNAPETANPKTVLSPHLTPPLRNRYFLGMTKDEQKPAQSLRTSAKSEARASKKTEARSAALRANLLKRKAQVKTRADNGAK
jgi:hypothetical protein